MDPARPTPHTLAPPPPRPTPAGRRRLRAAAFGAGVVVWVGLVAGATAVLTGYEQTAAPAASLPAPRPDLAADQPIVRMFAHPRCPCTRASVGELARLVAQRPDAARYEVWFFRPAAERDDWAHTDLWASASRIPGVRVFVDPDGEEARRAGVSASGHVVILDPHGAAVFTGGITLSRGHAGDNPGLDTARAWLDHLAGPASPAPAVSAAPVFGCAIHDAPRSSGPPATD